MARSIPAHRFADLVAAATRIFIAVGYRRTQMAEVARELGVAKGTVYGYVESKAALFALVLDYADRVVPREVPADLPFRTPAPGATIGLVAKRLADVNVMPLLVGASRRGRADDIDREFESITRELFQLLSTHRTGLKLLDRCALEVDELQSLWRHSGRRTELDLMERYLEKRMAAGQVAPISSSIGARIWLETIVTWAVHIHWDRDPEKLDELTAEDAVIALLRRGFVLHGDTK